MNDIGFEGLWEDWHVEELLGTGSYGSVYRVSRESMGHVSYAAAKLISIPGDPAELDHLRSMGMDDVEVDAYLEGVAHDVMGEIAVMESLKGASGVVAIEDYRLIKRRLDVGWSIWIRMELLEGLDHYLSRCGKPDAGEVVSIGIDICRALERCHAIGFVHRDVKPENVFRDKFGDYKLGDFGVSRSLEGTMRTALSQKGTPMYMAPEVARGDSYDNRVDIYSTGIMLYRLLNDMRYPLTPAAPAPVRPSDLRISLDRRHAGEKLPPPCDADEVLSTVILKACEANPERRYRTAAEFRAGLEAWRTLGRGGDNSGNGRRKVIIAAVSTGAIALALVMALAANAGKRTGIETGSPGDFDERQEMAIVEGDGGTLENAISGGDTIDRLNEQDEVLRERFVEDYPDVYVATSVGGNVIDTTISLGRELTPLESYSFQVWLRDDDMAEDVGQSLLALERSAGVEGIRHRYTVLDSLSSVIAQATFAGSGVVQFEGMDLRITLEDALNDPSIGEGVVESIRKSYESTEPGWQTWVTAQGNELKILLRSDRSAEDLDVHAAEENARSDGQIQRLSSMAALLEDTFHIEGVTVRLTLCDYLDNSLVSVAYSRDGIVSP